MHTASTHVESDRTGVGNITDRWYFPGMAIVMIAVAIAGFAPSIVNPSHRLGPVAPLVAAHGIAFFAWLLLFICADVA